MSQVEDLTTVVAEMRPNMHASDRLDSVSAKLKEIETELETSRERARSYGIQFENCRNECKANPKCLQAVWATTGHCWPMKTASSVALDNGGQTWKTAQCQK